MALTYKKAGVDVTAIKKSQKDIGKIIKSTHTGTVSHGFGHYAGVVRLAGTTLLATHTDGVGTKVLIAAEMNRYDTVGIDCIAMNVNDIVCIGATPVSFVDYIAASRNDGKKFAAIMRGLAKGAKSAGVPIVGGETAIMPDLFVPGKFAFDLSGMVTGTVQKKEMILGDKIRPGDVIIGAASTGLHSNGYTLARKALAGYSLSDRARGVGRIGAALLSPTQIYARPVLEAVKRCRVHGIAHITGGAFTKLLRLKNTGYHLDSMPEPPPIMSLIAEQGVGRTEMYRTFNMGVGMCVIAPRQEADAVCSIFKKHRIQTSIVGRIVSKKGVFVGSKKIA